MSKVVATVSTFVGHGGQSVWVAAGEEYDASDPLVKANPDMFTKLPEPERPERTRARLR